MRRTSVASCTVNPAAEGESDSRCVQMHHMDGWRVQPMIEIERVGVKFAKR